jgi:hypothetical protein
LRAGYPNRPKLFPQSVILCSVRDIQDYRIHSDREKAVITGGGVIDREYAIGSGRMDLCIRYGGVKLAIELKVWRDREADPLSEGLQQIEGYLQGLSLDGGWLVIFDHRSGQPRIRERTYTESARTETGLSITVIRA